MLTECPDCEMHFSGTRCSCGYTPTRGKILVGPWQTPDWMRAGKPCTDAENAQALKIVQAVMAKKLTVHGAHVALHTLFKGRELEGGVTTCACGIDLNAGHDPAPRSRP